MLQAERALSWILSFAVIAAALKLFSGALLALEEGWLPPEVRAALESVLGEWYVRRAEIETGKGQYERLIKTAVSLFKARAVRAGILSPEEAEVRAKELEEKAKAKLRELGVEI